MCGRWHNAKGYGFFVHRLDDEDRWVFCHRSALEGSRAFVGCGERVAFSIGVDELGRPHATDVEVLS
jgi:cold shock CspA family protein